MKKGIIGLLILCLLIGTVPLQRTFALEDGTENTESAEDEESVETIIEESTEDSFEEEESVSDVEESAETVEDEESAEMPVAGPMEEESSVADEPAEEESQEEEPAEQQEVLPDEETQKILDLYRQNAELESIEYMSGIDSLVNGDSIQSYATELAKFPSDYQTLLSKLHSSHPNWVFVAYNTGLDWSTAVKAESSLDRSLIPNVSSSLVKSNLSGDYNAESGSYITKDSGLWVTANYPIVSFNMDPRNFLNEKYIWMFESMTFSDVMTVDSVEGVLTGTFMSKTNSPYVTWLNRNGETVKPAAKDRTTYAQLIYNAGLANGISPMFLASKIRQEVGGGSGSVSGKYTTTTGQKYNGNTLDGIYNFYNIAANDSAYPITLGLGWAAGKPDREGTVTEYSYNRPWTSPVLSIHNGGQYVTDRYFANGQNCGYLIKFNVTPNHTYYYQYMTNVSGAASEAITTYSSYKTMGILDDTRVFYIPVFKNMPSLTEKPTFSGATGKGTISGDSSINMRSKASISGSVVTSLPKGTTVTIKEGCMDTTWGSSVYVMQQNPYWFYVEATVSGTTYKGYVSADFIKMTTAKKINVGSSTTLSLSKSLSQTVFYQSGNPYIATVDQNGKVTGVHAGTTDIYCYTQNGITAIGVQVNASSASAISISDSSITVSSIGQKNFSGTAIKPSPTIKKGSTTLKKGTDYTLSYSSNTMPGTATVTITGIGNYTGFRKVTFKIVGTYMTYYVNGTGEDGLNYRTGAGTSYSKAGNLSEGTAVQVLSGYSRSADGYVWYVVKVNGAHYYAASNYLKIKSGTTVFSDVKDASRYYYNAVYWAAAKGIAYGYSDGTFRPATGCTRGQFVLMLWRMAGKPAPSVKTNPFKDVKSTDSYYQAVLWAVGKGITGGYDDGTFRPNNTCLREHAVTFLWRYAGKPTVSGSVFSDVSSSAYYYKAVRWAVAKGITSGYSDGTFKPSATCLREHVAVFLYRYSLL